LADGRFLLALPTQSVAVRLIVGALLAVLAARILLRAGLRVPRIRVAAALIPTAAVVTILVVSFGAFRLPSLMIPTGSGGSVVVPIEDTYAYLAPLALPALVTAWAVFALGRAGRRIWRTARVSRQAAATLAAGEVPLVVRRSVRQVAARMEIDAPPIGVVSDCPGGATVVGIRRPVVVLDANLVAQLDDQELEGVIAHELAHVRRRDNLMALLMGVIRDLVFFVPGGRWALRQLLVERELAADQLAVETTARPGALAAGLLKVLDGAACGDGRSTEACAALLPQGTLVRRVSYLVDDRPAPSRLRRGGELLTLGTAFALVVGAATIVPRAVAGQDPDGGLGVLVTAPQTQAAATPTEMAPVEARAFTTYRQTAVTTHVRFSASAPTLDDHPDEVRPSVLAACMAGDDNCRAPRDRPTLGLRPRPQVSVDESLAARWHARKVVETGDVVSIYWLSTLR
jgi:Zn-dependent protease with chaperone function